MAQRELLSNLYGLITLCVFSLNLVVPPYLLDLVLMSAFLVYSSFTYCKNSFPKWEIGPYCFHLPNLISCGSTFLKWSRSPMQFLLPELPILNFIRTEDLVSILNWLILNISHRRSTVPSICFDISKNSLAVSVQLTNLWKFEKFRICGLNIYLDILVKGDF